jgi:uncharacterized protein YkwD
MTFGSLTLRAAQLGALAGISTFAQQTFVAPVPAPPTAPPKVYNTDPARLAAAPPIASAPFEYSVGDPSDEAQLYLELMNRSRKDPAAEALRLANTTNPDIQRALNQPGNPVNIPLMLQQYKAFTEVPPLSFNSKLTAAAKQHTEYLFNAGLQSHDQPNNFNLPARVSAQGYPWAGLGENVFSYSKYAEYGHAAFEVDWGGSPATGGMQSPAGHRNTIHDGDFGEVGIYVLHGTNVVPPNDPVGPELVTQDFGIPAAGTTFITGVAYYDWNGNNFYDLGEGLGGVRVGVDGVDAFAVTSYSGAYSIPVAKNQSYTVRFNAGGTETTAAATVANGNVKVDFKPTPVSTAVTASPSIVFAGAANLFQLAPLQGATGYRAQTRSVRAAPLEGAENGTAGVTLNVTGGVEVFSNFRAGGSKSFHLVHVTANNRATPQTITFKNPFYVKAGGRVDFMSRYGFAFLGEFGRVQVSTDGGASWGDVYAQAGRDQFAQPEMTFSAKSADLSAYAGKFVQLRFNFDVDTSKGWFDYADSNDGWYIDDIAFANIDEVTNTTLSDVRSSPTFPYTPPGVGSFLAQFQAVVGARLYPFGPVVAIEAQANPPVFTMVGSATSVTAGTVTLKFLKTSGTTTAVALVSSDSLNGPWTREHGAVITGPLRNEYQATVATSGKARFYRALAN